ncbi:MAG: LpxI family protein, partial [Alphaproteobacteria bacterium]|nr:LpxI family protein [Alphaproteobacteria bacterium]
MPPKLGILAGGGDLPGKLIDACIAAARPMFVIAFEGEADPTAIGATPHAWVGLAAVGKTLSLLREQGCEEVVLAGAVRRPSLANVRPDWRGAQLLVKLAGLRSAGDDQLLSVVVSELESEGFRVVGADAVLADLLAPTGAIGGLLPDEAALNDILLGVRVVRALGGLDIGQAAVVQQGRVLGVEAAEGTDALLARCAALRMAGPGGVLVKLRKPNQDP